MEPSHAEILRTPAVSVLVGTLPAHSRTLPHCHSHPTVVVTLLSTTFWNCVHSRDSPPQAKWGSVEKGDVLSYVASPSHPYCHRYTTEDRSSAFLCMESRQPVRIEGPPTPNISITAPPSCSISHHAADLRFSSVASLTLSTDAKVTIDSKSTRENTLTHRLIVRMSGAKLQHLHLESNGVPVQEITHDDKQVAVSVRALLLCPFPTEKPPPASIVRNVGDQSIEICIVDLFTTRMKD